MHRYCPKRRVKLGKFILHTLDCRTTCVLTYILTDFITNIIILIMFISLKSLGVTLPDLVSYKSQLMTSMMMPQAWRVTGPGMMQI